MKFWEFEFLILWASSTINTSHGILKKVPIQFLAPSKVVTTMSNFRGRMNSFRQASRYFSVLRRRTALDDGNHLFIYLIQLLTTDFGQMIRCFPNTPFYSFMYARYEIAWIVFPNPMSSANMPFDSWEAKLIIHYRASIWCCWSFPPTKFFGWVTSKFSLYLLKKLASYWIWRPLLILFVSFSNF